MDNSKNNERSQGKNKLSDFTPIPHEMLEKLMTINMSSYERRFFDYVARMTIGYHRKWYALPPKKIIEETNIPKAAISRTRKKLIDRGILKVNQTVNKNELNYYIVRDYTEWKRLTKKATVNYPVNKGYLVSQHQLTKQLTNHHLNANNFNNLQGAKDNLKDNLNIIRVESLASNSYMDLFPDCEEMDKVQLLISNLSEKSNIHPNDIIDNLLISMLKLLGWEI